MIRTFKTNVPEKKHSGTKDLEKENHDEPIAW